MIYCAESGGHDPLGREALIRFRGDSGTPARFTLHERRMEIPTPSALRHPFAFRAKPARLSGSSSMAEGGLFESQCLPASHPLATEPGTPVRFTFHGYCVRREGVGPSRHYGHWFLGPARLPFRHQRIELRAASGIRTRDPYLGKVVL
jgi:hypothetical protein